jgi:hypothetical protein
MEEYAEYAEKNQEPKEDDVQGHRLQEEVTEEPDVEGHMAEQTEMAE